MFLFLHLEQKVLSDGNAECHKFHYDLRHMFIVQEEYGRISNKALFSPSFKVSAVLCEQNMITASTSDSVVCVCVGLCVMC